MLPSTHAGFPRAQADRAPAGRESHEWPNMRAKARAPKSSAVTTSVGQVERHGKWNLSTPGYKRVMAEDSERKWDIWENFSVYGKFPIPPPKEKINGFSSLP